MNLLRRKPQPVPSVPFPHFTIKARGRRGGGTNYAVMAPSGTCVNIYSTVDDGEYAHQFAEWDAEWLTDVMERTCARLGITPERFAQAQREALSEARAAERRP